MKIPFSKYQGAGNDFILIDNRKLAFQLEGMIKQLCDRRYGIGADGVILLEPSLSADHKMRIFNADGSIPAMCGNGLRCLVDFVGADACRVEVEPRAFSCRKVGELIAVNLGVPHVLYWPIEINGTPVYVLDTGVPHAVVFVDDVAGVALDSAGSALRWHEAFAPEGANVDFVQIDGGNILKVRTFERGVEGETLSCGTGAAACAWAAFELHQLPWPLAVHTRTSLHGPSFQHSLSFSFPEGKIEMLGAARCVFTGLFDL